MVLLLILLYSSLVDKTASLVSNNTTLFNGPNVLKYLSKGLGFLVIVLDGSLTVKTANIIAIESSSKNQATCCWLV